MRKTSERSQGFDLTGISQFLEKRRQASKIRAEKKAKTKAEEEARRKTEAEARAKAEEEAKARAEEEARRRAEAEARRKAEAEARAKAEAEAKAKAKAEGGDENRVARGDEARRRIQVELKARNEAAKAKRRSRLFGKAKDREGRAPGEPSHGIHDTYSDATRSPYKIHKNNLSTSSGATGAVKGDGEANASFKAGTVSILARGERASAGREDSAVRRSEVADPKSPGAGPAEPRQNAAEAEGGASSDRPASLRQGRSESSGASKEKHQSVDKKEIKTSNHEARRKGPGAAQKERGRARIGKLFARKKPRNDRGVLQSRSRRGRAKSEKADLGGFMLKSTDLRTGIDLGTDSVKLVCGRGKNCLEEVTVVASESLGEHYNNLSEIERERLTVAALKRILDRHDLNRRNMGRICVAVRGDGASIREVIMPPLSEKDLQLALPYEAKTHLDIEAMERPVLAAQILGDAPSVLQDGIPLTRVLLVAVPAFDKNFPLRVLKRVGLEPEVLDLEQLASLNELVTNLPRGEENSAAVALLDIGSTHCSLHFSSREGGILSRKIGGGLPPSHAGPEAFERFTETLKLKIAETVFFYRQRYERDVAGLYLAGGGAMLENLMSELNRSLKMPVRAIDPVKSAVLAKSARKKQPESGSRFVTAFGLCRWGDVDDV